MQPPRLLVVEDDAPIGLELGIRLRKAGYEVLGPYSSAEGARAAARERRPDLGLIDVRIVGPVDGVDLAAELRERQGVPSVFLTAHADEITVRRALVAEPFGYLTKPFRESELLATVQLALQRVELERRLRERERQLSEAQRVGRLGAWHWDLVAQEVVWSDELLELFGIDRELSRSPERVLQLIHPEDRERLRLFLIGLARGEPGRRTLDYRLLKPDGTLRHVRSWGEAQRRDDGPPQRVAGIAQDVTEEQEARAAIAATEARFVAAFESAPDAKLEIDERGTICLANSAATELLGPAVLGRSASDALPASLAWAVQRTLAERRPTSLEFEHATLSLEGRIVPVGDREALVIVRDLTAMHAAERARREAAASLHQAQKLDAIGRLAGGIAHDFNNMLSIILGTAPLLLPLVAPEGRALLDEIVDASRRSSLLTNRLLAFARKAPAEPRVILVDEHLSSFAALLRRTLREDIELVLDLGAAGRAVRIDPTALEQIVLNLVINARDAIATTGRIVFTTAAVRGGPFPEPTLHLEVEDDGAGMAPEIVAHLFEPFFTTKVEGTGTGLGLATVRELVEAAGGRIAVRSTPSVGTVFDVFLPLAEGVPEPVGDTAGPTFTPRGERILVVEDEPGVRAVTARVLRNAGYDPIEARDGAEALEILARERFALVITDAFMPRMGGRELAIAAKRLPSPPPVIFLSGHANEALGELGTEVHKPVLPETLLRAVSTILSRA